MWCEVTTNTTVAEVVTTPTEPWLQNQLESCVSRFLVASPYVNNAFVDLIRRVRPTVEKVLVTRTDLRDFAMGSSSLETLSVLAADGVQVSRLGGLHAKVYVIDHAAALVTSANATVPGLRWNRECGVAVFDPTTVDHIAQLLLSGFGADESPTHVTLGKLILFRRPVEALRNALPRMPRINIPEAPETQYQEPFPLPNTAEFLQGFRGWRRLTIEALLAQPSDTFPLQQMYTSCEQLARRRYPRDRHVDEKVRQQLQQLRDLGLVEFLGGGRYRRIVAPIEGSTTHR